MTQNMSKYDEIEKEKKRNSGMIRALCSTSSFVHTLTL